jgi:cephalosporin hydroxylase
MTDYRDAVIPEYIKGDLLRMMARIAANEHWYEQEWLGVPIWQMPEDLMRRQQIVVEVKPKWIIETGTKFGGSAIFFSSILEFIGRNDGGVITADLAQYSEAVETFRSHPHAGQARKAIVGDAASVVVFEQAAQAMKGDEGSTLVFLDDNHNADHVYREMTLYSTLVMPGSYLIVADTVFEDMAGTPVGTPTESILMSKNPIRAWR